MSRIRYLKPDFFDDEDMALLPFEARMLYQGLWCYADRKGLLEYRPQYLKAKIFPYDEIDIIKLLNLLSNPNIPQRPDKKFIIIYTIEDKQYIKIIEFLKHQKPHHTEKESILPDLNGFLTVNSPSLNTLKEKDKEKDKEKEKEEGKETSSNKKIKLTDEEWIKSLKSNIAYSGIDIDTLYGKMIAWCEVKGKKPTRARLLNWLNREEKPMQGKLNNKPKLSPVWMAGAKEG